MRSNLKGGVVLACDGWSEKRTILLINWLNFCLFRCDDKPTNVPQTPPNPDVGYDLFFKILPTILSAIFGGTIAFFIERYRNRILILKKSYTASLIGMTRTSTEWGNIEMVWNGMAVNNLYVYNAWLFNYSGKDAPAGMQVWFSVPPGCYLLRQSAQVENGDITLELSLEAEWHKGLQEAWLKWGGLTQEEKKKNIALSKDIDHGHRHLKYVVPYLNRKGGVASFSILVGADQAGEVAPALAIGIHQPGIKLEVLEKKEYVEKNERVFGALGLALIILLVFPTIRLAPTPAWAAWLMVVNIFLGAIIPRIVAYMLRSLRVVK